MRGESFTLPDGQTLHRWTNPTGDSWACMAYDHGPFCRRCRPVDNEALDAILQHVVDGLVVAKQDPLTAEFSFTLTPAGERAAEVIIEEHGL